MEPWALQPLKRQKWRPYLKMWVCCIFCREGMHAERLLDGLLFGKQDPAITAEKMAEAEQVTSTICRRIEALKCGLNSAEIGIRPLVVERTE